ncbi:MAG: hypothetical protein CMF04_09330 [Hyphomonas sp.]|nr:hypothetical protein [Hyphomonas sp.]
MDDDIGLDDGRAHHRNLVGVALEELRARNRLAIAAPQARDLPVGVAEGDHRRIADMAIAAQNSNFSRLHFVLLAVAGKQDGRYVGEWLLRNILDLIFKNE